MCDVFEGVYEMSWDECGEVFWRGEGWEQGLSEVFGGGEEGGDYEEGV